MKTKTTIFLALPLFFMLTQSCTQDDIDCCDLGPDTKNLIHFYGEPISMHFDNAVYVEGFHLRFEVNSIDNLSNPEVFNKYAEMYGDTAYNQPISSAGASCMLDTIASINIYCDQPFLDKDSAASLNDYFLTSFYTHYYFIQSGYDRTKVDRLYYRTITEFNNEPIKHLFEPGCMIKFSDSLDLSGLSGPYKFTLEYKSFNGTTYTSSATVDF